MTAPFLAVVNPAAGGGRCGRRARPVIADLRAAGLVDEAVETTGPGDANRVAADAWSRGRRRFLAVGGDGTSFEILNGLFPTAPGADRPVLGHLPLGTGNSFLRDFGVTTDAEALARLRAGRTRTVDVVRADHADGAIHYLNLLSTGFSARAGALTNARFKGLGAAGYVVAVVWSVLGLEHPVLPLRLDEGDDVDARPSVLLSFSNSRYTAGTMCMAPLADPGDGALDVIRVGDLGRIAFLGAFPSIFAGRHVERPDVEQVRARRVRFEPVGVQDVMVDGEILRLDLRALEVLPGAIEVVA